MTDRRHATLAQDTPEAMLKMVLDREAATAARHDDRIEELEKACAEWAEVAQSDYQRAKSAEAKLAKVEALMDTGFAEYERRLAKAVEALREIAQQKKTDELETEYDVEVADFEGGYDLCIDRARATLAELKGQDDD